jgi:hypothetical protein
LSITAGCAASSYQSAKMLPPGGTRLGIGFSNYRLEGTSPSGSTTAIEMAGSYGMNDKLELGGKFGYFSEGGDQIYNLMVEPKFSLLPDMLAVNVPTGIAIADGGDEVNNGWVTMPGLVYTYPFNEIAELDLAGKLIAGFEDDFSDYNIAGALDVGARVSLPNTPISVFPEIGFIYDDDFDAGDDFIYVLQFGVMFQVDFGTRPPATGP